MARYFHPWALNKEEALGLTYFRKGKFMRKILMLTIALAIAAASRLPALVECNCTYCFSHPTGSCVIHTYLQSTCNAYINTFCVGD